MIGSWRKGYFRYIVAGSLVIVLFVGIRKIENEFEELGGLVAEILR